MSNRQKPRLLPAETQPRSDKFAGANLADRRSARRVPARDGQAQKAPQATFSHRLVRAARAARARRGRRREALPALLVELLANALALQIRQVVDEQLPVEVVDLVLDAHRQDVVVIGLERCAAAILRAQPDLRRALHFIENPRNRQTPFLGARLPFAREDLR